MNVSRDRFQDEVLGWVLRGVVCAAPSAFMAVISEFNSFSEISAMLTGVGFYVGLYAFWCERKGGSSFVKNLKLAAWIKGSLLVGAAGFLAIKSDGVEGGASVLGFMVMPDLIFGGISLGILGSLLGQSGPEVLASADSFGWTLIETILQGLLVSAEILTICGAIATIKALYRWRRPNASVAKF